jgi:hypothetical protein
MRKLIVGTALGVALLLPVLLGCNHTPIIGKRNNDAPPPAAAKPTTPALVKYLNDNAGRVSAVQSTSLDIDCKQDRQTVGLGGMLVCQKPRNFRLRAKVLAAPTVDVGSNSEEFWFWISKQNPPYVYHCSYKDLATGKVNTPFPFHPDMVVAALGMAEYDPEAKYELRSAGRYLELIQDTTSPQGQPAKRITVFNSVVVRPPEPQVVAHVLRDTKGNLLCQATVHAVKVDRGTGALLPTKVSLEWPAQRIKMTLNMSDVQAVNVDATRAARLFSRADLNGYGAYDLARGLVDTPDGIRRASTWPSRGR